MHKYECINYPCKSLNIGNAILKYAFRHGLNVLKRVKKEGLEIILYIMYNDDICKDHAAVVYCRLY